jgi:hypothetical protein
MNALTNWAKDAAVIFGILGLFLLWKYGDVLMETEVKTETVKASKHERLARCGLGFLILAIALYLVSSFL